MSIGKLINDYGRQFSPYSGSLVNHLPMGQLAYFKLTNDLEGTRTYTEEYVKRNNINKVKIEYPKVISIKECLGNPEMYESCLELIVNEVEKEGIDKLAIHILNRCELGMSSGLFHTLIRVAYAVEGKALDEELNDELAKALAYYVTAYKKADVFQNGVMPENAINELGNLINNPHIIRIRKEQNSLGQRLKALYSNDIYMKVGFVIRGSVEEKINTLLDILIPAYKNSDDIVVLHCITGLHALIVLKDYYDDFNKALDTMTTCIISHLLTLDKLNIINKQDLTGASWEEIRKRGSQSNNVHTVKLSYSASELYDRTGKEGLRDIALNRITRTN